MRELAIKQALALHLSSKCTGPNALQLLEEVDIHGGQVRADLVDVDKFHCYEIKSDGDSLSRLISQGARYAVTFDRVTLVSAERHLEAALNIVPSWWGVMVIPQVEGQGFKAIRRAKQNRDQDPAMLASLFQRDECMDLLMRRGELKGWKSKSLYLLQEHIAATLSLGQLKLELKYYLGLRSPMDLKL